MIKYNKSDLGAYPEGTAVIVRSKFGVYAGNLVSKHGDEIILVNARRLWRWAGAFTLSQLSREGVNKGLECKFPIPMTEVLLTGIGEMIKMSEEAVNSLNNVPIYGV